MRSVMYSLCFCIGTIISLVTANLFREIPYIVKLDLCDPPFWPYTYALHDDSHHLDKILFTITNNHEKYVQFYF